jgi:thiol-disulfide isomerase/thioredoxin
MSALRYAVGFVAAACAVWLVAGTLAGDKFENLDGKVISDLHADNGLGSFTGAVAWLNSKPFGADELRGKVVLVDFWTYSCINWQRTLPYVRTWAEKYQEQGLVVVGVHTPEFSFEKDLGNVHEATTQLRVNYPVAVDNHYVIWNAFGNNAWPALYLVDAHGRIRYRRLGEGGYEQTEKLIQELLVEAGAKGADTSMVRVSSVGSQAAADWDDLQSPETYVGSARTENFSSPGGLKNGKRTYSAPLQLPPNGWALTGDWTVGSEAAKLDASNGRIVYRFHARDLHLVMGPRVREEPVPFRILLDGKPPGTSHGADVDAQGNGILVEHRLYQLVRQTLPVVDRQFQIEFLAPGAEVFSFTFG